MIPSLSFAIRNFVFILSVLGTNPTAKLEVPVKSKAADPIVVIAPAARADPTRIFSRETSLSVYLPNPDNSNNI